MNNTELNTAVREINANVLHWMENGRSSGTIVSKSFMLRDQRTHEVIDSVVAELHGRNVEAGWWSDVHTGQRKDRNVGEMLMLAVSELCEVPESHKVLRRADDKLPHRLMFEVELADCLIRLFDTAGGTGVPLGVVCGKIMSRSFLPFGPWSPQWNDSMMMRPIRYLSEAMEANRKNKPVEYADSIAKAFLDVFAIGIVACVDVPGAIIEKVEFNARRADHKIENRKAEGGKAY